MSEMRTPAKYLCLLGLTTILALRADVRGCHCDLNNATEMHERACSLCAIAEQQPAYMTVFFLKDSNPTKPNRLLALPRVHGPGGTFAFVVERADACGALVGGNRQSAGSVGQ